jgi:class 3 adenylate cyclase
MTEQAPSREQARSRERGTRDPQLRAVIEDLERTGAAAELLDHEWRLVWVSDELKELLGEHDERKLGYGNHIVERYRASPWRAAVTDESAARVFRQNAPYVAHDTPGGLDTLAEMLGPDVASALEGIEPRPTPAFWSFELDLLQPDLPPARVWCHCARLHDEHGEYFGMVRVYAAGLRAGLLALVTRGDESTFERMARVFEPARRPAAVLFADLSASGVLSRRLPSGAYFRLLRSLHSALDAAVIECSGIVGKHAGDGASALFLADELGSDSAAARAALDSARRLPAAAEEAAGAVRDAGVPIESTDCVLRVGVHWGPGLYVGQIVTGGRLEVTALGDEVNEAARIEQSADAGHVLASKPLLERLTDDDAAALGIDPARIAYRMLAELPGVDEKATRDAGALAVADVSHRPDD